MSLLKKQKNEPGSSAVGSEQISAVSAHLKCASGLPTSDCSANDLVAKPIDYNVPELTSDGRQTVTSEALTTAAASPAGQPFRHDGGVSGLSSSGEGTTTSEDDTHTEDSDAVMEEASDSGSD